MPFDREKAAALLKSDAYTKAKPEVQQAIVARLRAEASSSHDTVSAAPKLSTWKGIKSAMYSGIDRALPFLPAAGATIGGAAAAPESGMLAAPAGGALGAVVGEGARDAISQFLFRNDPEQQADSADATNEAKRIIGQGALGFGTELGAQGSSRVLSSMAKPFEKSAATFRATQAGEGIRLTPGEASGSPALKKIENVSGHLPGGVGPWHRFREKQAADAAAYFQKQIAQLGKGANREQLGQTVQQFVTGAERQIDAGYAAERQAAVKQLGIEPVNAETAGKGAQQRIVEAQQQVAKARGEKFDEVRKLLGKQPGEFISPEEFDAAVKKQQAFYRDMGGTPPPTAARLQDARSYTYTSSQQFEQDILAKIAKTQKPEAIPTLLRRAGLEDLRVLERTLPPETRLKLGQSVLSQLTAESTVPATGEISGTKLGTALAKLGEERGKLLFGAERWSTFTKSAGRLAELERNLPAAREAFRSDLMQKVASSGQPEAVAALFENASLADIRSLHGQLPEPMRRQVSADVLAGIVERGTDPQTGHLAARSIARSLQDLGEGRGRLLFGKQYDAVMQGSRLMDRMRAPGGEGMGQMHQFRAGGALAGAAASLAAFSGHGAAVMYGIGTEMAAVRTLTAALTNPATSALALKVLRIAAATTARGVPYGVNAVFNQRDQDEQAPAQ
jgi:hypothetical protein